MTQEETQVLEHKDPAEAKAQAEKYYADKASEIEKAIADYKSKTENIGHIEESIKQYDTIQNARVAFQTQADQGNITLNREVVQITSPEQCG